MICKTCGKKSHYCTSCDPDYYLSEGYCGITCWMESDEYKTYEPKLREFWNSLDENQKSNLWALWDNGILIDDAWELIIDTIFTA